MGLIAADVTQFSRLLGDLVQHYQHYRRTAIEYSQTWAPAHRAGAVIGTLNAAVQAGHGRHAAA